MQQTRFISLNRGVGRLPRLMDGGDMVYVASELGGMGEL